MYHDNGPWGPIDPGSQLPMENFDPMGNFIPPQLYPSPNAQGHQMMQQMMQHPRLNAQGQQMMQQRLNAQGQQMMQQQMQHSRPNAQGHQMIQQQMPQLWHQHQYASPMWNHNMQLGQGYMAHPPRYHVPVGQTQPALHHYRPPMQHQRGVHQATHQQHQQAAAPPPTTNLPNPPQAQAPQGQPTYLQIKLGKFLGLENLRTLFDTLSEQDFTIEEPYGYVKFGSEVKAEQAKSMYANVFDATIGVGPTSLSSDSSPSEPVLGGSSEADASCREGPTSESELVLGSTEAGDSNRGTKSLHRSTEADDCNTEATDNDNNDRPSAHMMMMRWRPVLNFMSDKKKSLVEADQLSTAKKFGDVRPSAEITRSTYYGNRFGTGYLHYMEQVHLAGMSWAGKFKRRDLVVSNTCLCMIDKFPDSLATHLNIKKDLLALIDEWFSLYHIKGRRPPYFDDLLEKMKNPPKDTGNVVNYVKILSNFFERLVHHSGFANEATLCLVLQEIWVNCKPKKTTQTDGTPTTTVDPNSINFDFPTGVMATDLGVFVSIDKLLGKTYKKKNIKRSTTHSEEGEYLRHIVNHIKEHADPEGFFPVKERIALLGWYFENFMQRFVDMMAENKNNRDWLRELWEMYKKEEFELGAMIFDEIWPMRKYSVALEPGNNNLPGEVAGKLGIGLRNRPGENNCFLNVTVQMLFHVKLFCESLLKMDGSGSHSQAHQAHHSIAQELTRLLKALMKAREDQSETITVTALRTALSTAYPLEHFEEGSEHEVSLALKLILESIHVTCAVKSYEGEESCKCTTHAAFGVDSVEWTHCPCGTISDKKKYASFTVSIKVLSLMKSLLKSHAISFSHLVKAVLTDDKFSCANEHCEQKNHLARTLLAPPSVYSIEFEWTLEDDDVGSILNAMSSGIDLNLIYEDMDQGARLHPLSMACFTGMHCICFVLQEDEWVMFNDLTVKPIGSWSNLVEFCIDGGWKPTLVFFQSASSSIEQGETCEASSSTEALGMPIHEKLLV